MTLLSVSIDLSVLNISYKRNHTTCGPFVSVFFHSAVFRFIQAAACHLPCGWLTFHCPVWILRASHCLTIQPPPSCHPQGPPAGLGDWRGLRSTPGLRFLAGSTLSAQPRLSLPAAKPPPAGPWSRPGFSPGMFLPLILTTWLCPPNVGSLIKGQLRETLLVSCIHHGTMSSHQSTAQTL